MTSVWKFIKVYAKAIAAFVAGVVGNVIVNLLNGSTPWPQTTAQWVQLALTSFGPAIATWLTTGKITQKQIDKDPNVIGGTVVPDAQVPPAAPPIPEWAGQVDVKVTGGGGGVGGSYQNPWKKPRP